MDYLLTLRFLSSSCDFDMFHITIKLNSVITVPIFPLILSLQYT